MTQAVEIFGRYLVLAVELTGIVIVGTGALVAFWRYAMAFTGLRQHSFVEIRLGLTRALLLGLEFELGADVISTTLAPGFQEIARLAAVATIRTVLNYFLTKEMERETRELGAKVGR